METATLHQTDASVPADGSRTMTLTGEESTPNNEGPSEVGWILLHGAAHRASNRVRWAADVTDNEGCGKKKSKGAYSFLRRSPC